MESILFFFKWYKAFQNLKNLLRNNKEENNLFTINLQYGIINFLNVNKYVHKTVSIIYIYIYTYSQAAYKSNFWKKL